MKLYKVTTRFLGADGPSYYYFDTKEKAQKYLDELENGEIEAVEIKADYKLNYHDGCTLADLTFGNFDADVIVL